ncbi:MAG: DinB family protein [Armatimonadetes bacterium]|nr:DinB family protein [Armatimonadota bacterium]
MTRADVMGIWQPLAASLLEKVKMIPDDAPGLDTPAWEGTFHDGEREKQEAMLTPRQLIAHCTVATYDVPRALVMGEGFEQIRTAGAELAKLNPSGLAQALEQRIAKLMEFLQNLPDERFEEDVATPLGTFSVGQVLARAALHVTHHKGQLHVVMRLMGLRPGRFI